MLIVDDVEPLIGAAIDGMGWRSCQSVTRSRTCARLLRVLEEWCPPCLGFFLYDPRRQQQTAARSAPLTCCARNSARRQAGNPKPVLRVF
jgi:hypothetical protein